MLLQQVLGQHVHVVACHLHGGMPQDLLEAEGIASRHEVLKGERVAELVDVDGLDAGPSGEPSDQLAERSRRHLLAVDRQEEVIDAGPGGLRAEEVAVAEDGPGGVRARRDDALSVPLAQYLEIAVLQPHVVETQVAELRGPQARVQQGDQDGAVAGAEGRMFGDLGQKPLDLLLAEGTDHRLALSGPGQSLQHVAVGVTLRCQPGGEHAQGGDVAEDGVTGEPLAHRASQAVSRVLHASGLEMDGEAAYAVRREVAQDRRLALFLEEAQPAGQVIPVPADRLVRAAGGALGEEEVLE